MKTTLKFPSHITTWKHNPSVNLTTMRQILTIQPKRVIDVGAGNGFYAKLLKELLDEVHVFGIEATEKYIEQFELPSFYDKIICGDIIKEIDSDEVEGDLIIFGDVLEHLHKEEVKVVLEKADKKFNFILINSPLGFRPQEHHNPYEVHKCGLDFNDFKNFTVLEYETFPRHSMLNCLIYGSKNSM